LGLGGGGGEMNRKCPSAEDARNLKGERGTRLEEKRDQKSTSKVMRKGVNLISRSQSGRKPTTSQSADGGQADRKGI